MIFFRREISKERFLPGSKVTAVLQAPRARQDPRFRQEGVRAPAEVGAVFDASVSSSLV